MSMEATTDTGTWVLNEDGDITHGCGQQAGRVGARSYECACGSRLTNRMGSEAALIVSLGLTVRELQDLQGVDMKWGVAQRSPDETLRRIKEMIAADDLARGERS